MTPEDVIRTFAVILVAGLVCDIAASFLRVPRMILLIGAVPALLERARAISAEPG